MSIRNGKFQRTTYDTDAKIEGHRRTGQGVRGPASPWGDGGAGGRIDDMGVQESEAKSAVGAMWAMQNMTNVTVPTENTHQADTDQCRNVPTPVQRSVPS